MVIQAFANGYVTGQPAEHVERVRWIDFKEEGVARGHIVAEHGSGGLACPCGAARINEGARHRTNPYCVLAKGPTRWRGACRCTLRARRAPRATPWKDPSERDSPSSSVERTSREAGIACAANAPRWHADCTLLREQKAPRYPSVGVPLRGAQPEVCPPWRWHKHKRRSSPIELPPISSRRSVQPEPVRGG